ncbi:MAG: hypothetical protein ABSB82_02720 [Terriglobia bacterium]
MQSKSATLRRRATSNAARTPISSKHETSSIDRDAAGVTSINRRRGHRHAIGGLWWQVAVISVLFAMPVAGQDAVTQIQAEIDRLQQFLKAGVVQPPGFPDVNSMVGDPLKAAAASLRAGRLYMSLEYLDQATDLLHGVQTVADKAEAVKSGLPAFESEWGKTSLELTALEPKVREKNWEEVRAAIRALAEAAQGKAIPLLDGGRGFATAIQPRDGLFYVGQAQGEAAFARFCAALNLPRNTAPLALRSMLPELTRLQEKTNAAFQPPRSVELHPRFIALNSTLKLAEELDAARFYAGAFYQYLEAVRHYGLLDAPPLNAAQQAELTQAIAAMRKKLEASRRDDSIAQLFLERAESQLAHADGSAPSQDEWRSAKVIVDQVLPAYFAALTAPSPVERPSGKRIEITLVRWPYT